MKSLLPVHLFIVFVFIILLPGCSLFNNVTREVNTKESFRALTEKEIGDIKSKTPYLKVHMKNGYVYVLNNWVNDNKDNIVYGDGVLYNEERDSLKTGEFIVGMDSVSLLETNVLKPSGAQTALTIFAGITAAITVACIMNPKACFGSCPTFYVEDDSGLHLRAEGFSSSIAPSMEATDIDALYRAAKGGEEFHLEMRNEALETHVVRKADLIAVPKGKGSRVFADNNGNFWESKTIIPPVLANTEEGDAVKLLGSFDEKEWFSKSDSNYLGTKEIIELEFKNVPNSKKGIVIGCRQTLLSTYLLYQALAYMGNNTGYWLSLMERQKIKINENAMSKIMGGIEVLTQDSSGNWNINGVLDEQGPLADDLHLIPLNKSLGKNLKVRLRMTKGNWRIDYTALALDLMQRDPIRIKPNEVLKEGIPDKESLSLLCDSTKVLITLPGDNYTLNYKIPNNAENYELFLESRGYYLEWIRKEWQQEGNTFYLTQMLMDPENALKRLAPEFKSVESKMEESFWRSRYAKP